MRIKFIPAILLCLSLFIPLNVLAAAPQTAEAHPWQSADIVPGELIVIMKPGNSMNGLDLPEQARASTKKRPGLEKLNARVIHVPAGQESVYIAKLKQQEGVLTVEPNYIVHADLYPNDPAYPTNQYGPALIQAESAWDTTTGSNSVIIAIIDSGLDTSHPEFAGRMVAGYDYVQDDFIPQDDYGHGTHVAGIAAATGNNAQGIAGIAWGVKIMPLRVLDRFGNGSFSNVSEAIIYAADNGAKIINLSLGASFTNTTLANAVQYAYSHGAAIFAASGNANDGFVYYPAAYPQVMAVGSVGATAVRSTFSNYGTDLDLMAPGETIYSTLPMNSGFFFNTNFGLSTQYDTLSGTSMASPHAAGAAALLASLSCFNTPDRIYQALTDSARDIGTSGWDEFNGYGLIQIADAMALCPTTPPGTPFTTEYDMVTSLNCNPLVQYNWRNAVIGGASVGDSGSRLSNLPFTFNYGGQPYTSVRLHANGYISLGNHNTDPTNGNFSGNLPLPAAAKPDNFIAPFWDDLTDNLGTGRIYTSTQGILPNRQFVIEYRNFMRSGTSSNLNFEVILFEGSNNIKMQYRSLTGTGADGSSATVGLEYGNIFSGFAAYEYSYNQVGALQDGFALLFIPYTGGSPTLPSNAVCPQTQAVTIEAGISAACDGSPTPFDVDIPAGALPYRSTLKIQQLTSAPAMPASFLDLGYYADIRLAYSPPAPSLSPMPQVDVCYAYTPQDLLVAGGHPENLFIAAHDASIDHWYPLATTVDLLNSRLIARAPHFSYYGVATLNPVTAGSSNDLGLPVTGIPLSREFIISLVAGLSMIFLLRGIWLRKQR